MDQFTIDDSNVFTQVNVMAELKAFTSVFQIIDGDMKTPAITTSGNDYSGRIQLGSSGQLLWADLSHAGLTKGQGILFKTVIYGLPSNITDNAGAKQYVLDNVKITSSLRNITIEDFAMDENDVIVLEFTRTATVYKKIALV